MDAPSCIYLGCAAIPDRTAASWLDRGRTSRIARSSAFDVHRNIARRPAWDSPDIRTDVSVSSASLRSFLCACTHPCIQRNIPSAFAASKL
jgi:hypothetical protein